jgi:hypothetical protein
MSRHDLDSEGGSFKARRFAVRIARTPRGRSETRWGWLSTYTATQSILLIASGVLLLFFGVWLPAAQAGATGMLGLIYARRRYGPQ